MADWLQRLSLLFGEDAIRSLAGKTAAVVGLGGVGAFAAEALARSGVGKIILVDGDVVDNTNRNRQLPAMISTLGQSKAEVVTKRISDINPECDIITFARHWHLEEDFIFDLQPDYIVDAIDSFKDKIDLILCAKRQNVSIISAMGAGGKVDGSMFEVADLSKTVNDPLARRVRQTLRKQGVEHLKVVYSKEKPIPPTDGVIGSAVFATGVSGLLLAGEVIKDLVGESHE